MPTVAAPWWNVSAFLVDARGAPADCSLVLGYFEVNLQPGQFDAATPGYNGSTGSTSTFLTSCAAGVYSLNLGGAWSSLPDYQLDGGFLL